MSHVRNSKKRLETSTEAQIHREISRCICRDFGVVDSSQVSCVMSVATVKGSHRNDTQLCVRVDRNLGASIRSDTCKRRLDVRPLSFTGASDRPWSFPTARMNKESGTLGRLSRTAGGSNRSVLHMSGNSRQLYNLGRFGKST